MWCRVFFSSKFQRSVEELLVSPVSNSTILLGYVLGGTVRGLYVGVLVMLMGAFFVDLQIYSVTVTLLAVLMTAILFALGGFINAIFAKKFDDVLYHSNLCAYAHDVSGRRILLGGSIA